MLKFNEHVADVEVKARPVCGVIKRASNGKSDVAIKLYRSLCLPSLDYCCFLWSPYTQHLADRLGRCSGVSHECY